MNRLLPDFNGGPRGAGGFDRRRFVTTWLAVASAFCCGLVVVRSVWLGTPSFSFLIWNLFLAWLPLLAAIHIRDAYRARRFVSLPAAGLFWLLFFPNAPYIVTDFVHLGANPAIPLWFDLLMIGSFAWTGLITGYLSLHLIHEIVRERWGNMVGWTFASLVLGLGGFGIYLGRVLRWNSWDIVTRPGELLIDIARRLADPIAHPGVVLYTVALASFLTITYFVLVTFFVHGTVAGARVQPKRDFTHQ